MIKIHRDNRVIFWLLIGGLVLNILWSLRLELHAQTSNAVGQWDYNVHLSDKCYFRMDRQNPLINIRAQDCGMSIGNQSGSEYLYIAAQPGAELFMVRDKGIRLKSQKVIELIADGDINIQSTNGEVKINGKKINMNKEDSKSK